MYSLNVRAQSIIPGSPLKYKERAIRKYKKNVAVAKISGKLSRLDGKPQKRTEIVKHEGYLLA